MNHKMANELMVLEAVREVSNAVSSLIVTYRETHIVSKTKKQALKVRIKSYLAIEKSHAIAEVARSNIQEIAKTMDLIDRLELSASGQVMAMDMLEEQHKQLKQLLEDCRNGF